MNSVKAVYRSTGSICFMYEVFLGTRDPMHALKAKDLLLSNCLLK